MKGWPGALDGRIPAQGHWPLPILSRCFPPSLAESLFFASDFQREAESDGKKKGKFKTMKVLKLLGNKRDAKSKAPAGKS